MSIASRFKGLKHLFGGNKIAILTGFNVGLDDGVLDCVLEIKGSYKIGKMMPGTLIPVLEESKLFTDQPEYALLFSWHIADELMPKLREKGFRGRFIVPLPTPVLI